VPRKWWQKALLAVERTLAGAVHNTKPQNLAISLSAESNTCEETGGLPLPFLAHLHEPARRFSNPLMDHNKSAEASLQTAKLRAFLHKAQLSTSSILPGRSLLAQTVSCAKQFNDES
jgi:hypothetical protein